MASNHHDANISYLVIGVGLGVLAGLLLAPRAGEETRRQLRSGANEGLDYLAAEAEKLGAGAERWVAGSKNLMEQLRTWMGRARRQAESVPAQSAE
jgi:gas vesicle protein